jgi:hypothetical protein
MKKSSTQSPTSDIYREYVHPWYEFNSRQDGKAVRLIRPNPPTAEAVKRAQFVDKTYKWTPKTR